jgi:hypothetical protein|tara:strand:+ start:459 stop:794 length:336 start_codon:yes stop_codon:yes gene_type:complete
MSFMEPCAFSIENGGLDTMISPKLLSKKSTAFGGDGTAVVGTQLWRLVVVVAQLRRLEVAIEVAMVVVIVAGVVMVMRTPISAQRPQRGCFDWWCNPCHVSVRSCFNCQRR